MQFNVNIYITRFKICKAIHQFKLQNDGTSDRDNSMNHLDRPQLHCNVQSSCPTLIYQHSVASCALALACRSSVSKKKKEEDISTFHTILAIYIHNRKHMNYYAKVVCKWSIKQRHKDVAIWC